MNPQSNATQAHPEARIDQVLEALRTAAAPAGLEQRIAARIAQAAEALQASAPQARTLTTTDNSAAPSLFAVIRSLFTATDNPAPTSFFAVILSAARSAKSKDPHILFAEAKLYTLAATALTLLLTISTIAILHHRTPTTIVSTTAARTTTIASTTPASLTPASSTSLERAGLQSRHNAPTRNPALAAEGISHPANTQAPQGFSLGSHSPTQRTGVLTPAPPQQPTDPDTIALAETLAPSHPAPLMPLTQQERLMLSATRPGAPIELAELDLAREPILRAAAEAHQKAGLQQIARSLLSQLVTVESLDPTSHSGSHDEAQPTPAPDAASSNQPPTNGASQ